METISLYLQCSLGIFAAEASQVRSALLKKGFSSCGTSNTRFLLSFLRTVQHIFCKLQEPFISILSVLNKQCYLYLKTVPDLSAVMSNSTNVFYHFPFLGEYFN